MCFSHPPIEAISKTLTALSRAYLCDQFRAYSHGSKLGRLEVDTHILSPLCSNHPLHPLIEAIPEALAALPRFTSIHALWPGHLLIEPRGRHFISCLGCVFLEAGQQEAFLPVSEMPPSPKRRKRVGAPNGIAGSSFTADAPGAQAARRDAGFKLHSLMLALFASQTWVWLFLTFYFFPPSPPPPFRKPSKIGQQKSGVPRKDAQRRADSDGAILVQFQLLWTPFVAET